MFPSLLEEGAAKTTREKSSKAGEGLKTWGFEEEVGWGMGGDKAAGSWP